MPKSVLVQVVRLSISFEKEVHERVTDLADAHDVSTAWTFAKLPTPIWRITTTPSSPSATLDVPYTREQTDAQEK